ncbi:gamma-glutamyl-gamma-aminobutyrate hydrolase family protein [Bacillus sp. FJAT-42315]|uniref:gamma-glutamyl-gamma-aminobutyrate hydrolase family protein n=1 Tax=Bacillus sp. FJAT-42315 TaxID=2014077 RepID=UPI001E592C86|nr:gamma-glutamyl-gamma-aminobutyrate hydrolase family protein [Bacillus sp. FJAT-42315]
MKPLIGCTTYYVSAFEENKLRFSVAQDHFMSALDDPLSIQKGGGVPIAIPLIDDEDYIESIVDHLDGLLLTGGSDINPQLYGQPYKKGLGDINPLRDAFEMKLLEKAIKKQIPILGICRGLQLLNIFFGGTLIQDMDQHHQTDLNHAGYMGPRWNIAHKVKLAKGSVFYHCFEKEEIEVNSFHHQIIDTLGQGLEITALSEDEVVEGIVHKDYPFVVAVQWHPEMMFEVHQEQLKLFKLFVDYCKRSKAKEFIGS